jgi:hypothetical protein
MSPHFNMTIELPLKPIVRGYSYAVVPISWRGRHRGSSAFEMCSRYLTKRDYQRPADEKFAVWSGAEAEVGDARSAAGGCRQ